MLVELSAQAVLSSSSLLLSFVLGIFAHLSIFKHGEWDESTLRICKGYLVAVILLTTSIATRSSTFAMTSWFHASLCATAFFLVHFAGITTSILVYRLFFHRLRGFTGPVMARCSGWWWTYRYARTFHMYDDLAALHAEYGDYVRVGETHCPYALTCVAANTRCAGPNTVSIRDGAAMPIINGHSTPTIKGPFYDFALPKVLVNTERDEVKHAQRRRTWESAFSTKALRSYEPIMNLHANKLLTTIEASLGQPLNISEYATTACQHNLTTC